MVVERLWLRSVEEAIGLREVSRNVVTKISIGSAEVSRGAAIHQRACRRTHAAMATDLLAVTRIYVKPPAKAIAVLRAESACDHACRLKDHRIDRRREVLMRIVEKRDAINELVE